MLVMVTGLCKSKAYSRFMIKVNKTDNCWLWTACKNVNGYGVFGLEGKPHLAHRVSYEMHVGPISKGLVIDHLCRNRSCVNPEHLEPVDQRENIMRGESPAARCAKVTHCPQGHEYNKENTRLYRGYRYCRVCDRQRKK